MTEREYKGQTMPSKWRLNHHLGWCSRTDCKARNKKCNDCFMKGGLPTEYVKGKK